MIIKTAQHVKAEWYIYSFYLCLTKTPHVALQLLSSINFFPLVLLSTVEIGSLSNDDNGKQQYVYSFICNSYAYGCRICNYCFKQTIKKIG